MLITSGQMCTTRCFAPVFSNMMREKRPDTAPHRAHGSTGMSPEQQTDHAFFSSSANTHVL
jgi:hypothetical protein